MHVEALSSDFPESQAAGQTSMHLAQVAECLRATNMPNAYFFTKRMAEVLISQRHSSAFPVAIVRPSLVGCTARSPHPGYFGNNAGPTSIALAFALGIATFTSHRVSHHLLICWTYVLQHLFLLPPCGCW